MILGTSHITNKYIDVNEYCHDDGITFHNNEKVAKQKINVILDDVSLERVFTKFLGVIITLKKSKNTMVLHSASSSYHWMITYHTKS